MIRCLPLLLLTLACAAPAPHPGTAPQTAGEGTDAAAALEARFGLDPDRARLDYVRAIGRRLLAVSRSPAERFRFRILELVEPNAFAFPGGHVYVSRGLLALLNREDELAGVLAHEIAHLQAGHAASRRDARARWTPLHVAAGLGGLAAGGLSPSLGRSVAEQLRAPLDAALRAYGQEQETEADREAQRLLAAAGWEPLALATLLHTLAREHAHRAHEDGGGFLRTHPGSTQRIAYARAHAARLARAPARPIAADRRAFLGRLDGLVVGVRAAGGVWVGRRFLHPDLHVGWTAPEGWQTRTSRDAVVARSPDGRAVISLAPVAAGDDPAIAADAFASARPLRGEPRALRISTLPALHAEAPAGVADATARLHLTWIAHAGTVFQVAGLAPADRYAALLPVFNESSRSFRPLRRAERDEVRELRLRFTEARRGETLPRLLARAASAWTPEEAAIANALEPDAVPGRGALVKLARRERYPLR